MKANKNRIYTHFNICVFLYVILIIALFGRIKPKSEVCYFKSCLLHDKIFSTVSWVGYYYYLDFTEEESEL